MLPPTTLRPLVDSAEPSKELTSTFIYTYPYIYRPINTQIFHRLLHSSYLISPFVANGMMTQAMQDLGGRGAWKWSIRRRIWDTLEEKDIAQFPR